jgi:hypothetical protein
MDVFLLKSKINRAIVTDGDVNKEGSLKPCEAPRFSLWKIPDFYDSLDNIRFKSWV